MTKLQTMMLASPFLEQDLLGGKPFGSEVNCSDKSKKRERLLGKHDALCSQYCRRSVMGKLELSAEIIVILREILGTHGYEFGEK
ncbi:hypothetical protein LCGC14_0619540 [marine sediment metagenome]|uniref:Uncharacterized protein n=1 Tax=marine sediment metagenome TaxID=412755 RepID=A0A0F9RPP8_9ZZZZ|nr:hypothetical protein [Actinomycetota bacterium]